MSDLTPFILPFINEALKVLGLWALAPVLLCLSAWEVRRRFAAKDEQIHLLRQQNEDLQNKRLQDVRELIQIAEAGTAATAARTKSDERFADLLEALLRRSAGSGIFGWRRS